MFVFLGHSGVGKTMTSSIVETSLYLTPTDNGRQGFVKFVGGMS